MTKTSNIEIVADIFDQFEDEFLLVQQLQVAAVPAVGLDAVVDERVRVLVGDGTDERQRPFDVGHQRAQQSAALELVRRYLPDRRGGPRRVFGGAGAARAT